MNFGLTKGYKRVFISYGQYFAYDGIHNQAGLSTVQMAELRFSEMP